MAVRFLIVKHLSLGLGVLIKREDHNVGTIFFAESQTSKAVLLTHPSMSVVNKVTLTEFVNSSLFEGLFDERTKQIANTVKNNTVIDMQFNGNECYGTMIDGKEMPFKIYIDNNSFINLSCHCQTEGTCPHLYLAFLKIKELISHNKEYVTVNYSIPNDFKELLERYFYLRGGDNISLVSKINHMIQNQEKCHRFIEQLTAYYLRGQYKARSVNDILMPLFFNEKNIFNFTSLIDDLSLDSMKMIEEAKSAYKILKDDFDKRGSSSKKANIYHILLAPDCQGLYDLLLKAEQNFNEERAASQVMVEYLKYQDLSIDDIYLIKKSYIFQMNHRFYINEIMNGPAKQYLGTYLLFFDELPYNENKIAQTPIEYFLKVSLYSNDKSRYIPVVHSRFDDIKESDYPLLVELLVGVSLQHDYVDERVIRLSIELSKRIPSSKFVNELVETNIRRPKKNRAY